MAQKVKAPALTIPLVSITGLRQSGKTTMAKHVFPDYAYVNLKTPLTPEYTRENPNRLHSYARGWVDLPAF